MSFLLPKVPKPPLPPKTPSLADAANLVSPEASGQGYTSLISTTMSGLKRKAETQKRSLIGG